MKKVLLIGPSGVGKSFCVKHVGEAGCSVIDMGGEIKIHNTCGRVQPVARALIQANAPLLDF